MKQRVREQGGSLLCAHPLCWQFGFALHICWSGELDMGCIAGSVLSAADISLQISVAK